MSEHIYEDSNMEHERYHVIPFGSMREEIVRCRDCIGLVETWDGWECERFSGEYHRAEPKGFCAWGERRTDDN